MTEELRNLAVFRRYLTAFSTGDLDAFDDIIAPDYLNHSPSLPGLPRGPEGLKPIVTDLRRQAPGLRFEEVHVLAYDDVIAAHLLVHGFGPEPVRQMQVERLLRGKIVEHWRVTA